MNFELYSTTKVTHTLCDQARYTLGCKRKMEWCFLGLME